MKYESFEESVPDLAVGSLPEAAPRIAFSNVSPEIAGGAYAVKAIIGDLFVVECDVLTDGHEQTAVALRYRTPNCGAWREVPMRSLGNDRWRGEFVLEQRGTYEYTLVAWRDVFATWLAQATIRKAAGQRLDVEFDVVRGLLKRAADEASGKQRRAFLGLLAEFNSAGSDTLRLELLGAAPVRQLLCSAPTRTFAVAYDKVLSLLVERKAAAFSAWYELMPRSQANDEARHGTFEDVIARLPYVRDMGFDVLYLPPIHPIGRTNRKGRNNALTPARRSRQSLRHRRRRGWP